MKYLPSVGVSLSECSMSQVVFLMFDPCLFAIKATAASYSTLVPLFLWLVLPASGYRRLHRHMKHGNLHANVGSPLGS